MPRRGRKPYEEGLHQKQSYQTRDNTKLKIINHPIHNPSYIMHSYVKDDFLK